MLASSSASPLIARYLMVMLAIGTVACSADAPQAGPSFDCAKARGEVEQLICKDEKLAALDNQLASVYTAAAAKAANEHPPVLKAMQRGWIKGRNDCWKSDDKQQCIAETYQRRIAELQAKYRLVERRGPIFYACEGNPANEVVINFFETTPPTLIAERGDSVALMYLEPSASGTRYKGKNDSFWEHQGQASLVWGYGAAEISCMPNPNQ
uniref:MliC family protein n=1 Tax=Microbulbifer agarilyticus TaxID=260552 RepID=UPI0002557B23|nr:MliC family protein [Microbulbifer agarilyticus]